MHAKATDMIPTQSKRQHRLPVPTESNSEQAATGQSSKETKAGLNIYIHPLRETLRLERERKKTER